MKTSWSAIETIQDWENSELVDVKLGKHLEIKEYLKTVSRIRPCFEARWQ